MFSFRIKALQNGFGSPRNVASPASAVGSLGRPESPNFLSSPKIDMGEIDTRAPFESVKAAVSLFGDVGSPRARPMTKKTKAEEQKLLEREAQYHMIIRELDCYRDQLISAEATKDKALKDMQRANLCLVELTNRLETVSETKQAAISAAEAAKTRAKELEEKKSEKSHLGNDAWKADLDAERERYKAISVKLIDSKQELTNLRQDFDAALETKLRAFQHGEDSLQAIKSSKETESRLFEEVSMLRDKLDQIKTSSQNTEEEHLRLIAEKEVHLLVYKSAKQTSDMELEHLRQECAPEDDPVQKLEEVTEAIKILKEQLIDVYASDFNSLNTIVLQLVSAKNELEALVFEENSIRSSSKILESQLEERKRELYEWGNKARDAKTRLEQIETELENKKAELQAYEDMKANICKLITEAEKKKQEKEEILENIETLKREAETARISANEAEEKLQRTLMETREAENAKKVADDHIHNSPKKNDTENSTGSSRRIVLTDEEFQLMNNKIEELKIKGDEKVSNLRIYMKKVRESEKEVEERVDLVSLEVKNIELEIDDAVKRREMAEAAKRIIEDELQKWRQYEIEEFSGVSGN